MEKTYAEQSAYHHGYEAGMCAFLDEYRASEAAARELRELFYQWRLEWRSHVALSKFEAKSNNGITWSANGKAGPYTGSPAGVIRQFESGFLDGYRDRARVEFVGA